MRLFSRVINHTSVPETKKRHLRNLPISCISDKAHFKEIPLYEIMIYS